MAVQRVRSYPYPSKFTSLDDAYTWASRFTRATQDEAIQRIEDFSILNLSHVPWIDVREKGAVGNGVHDDTVAINAAATAVRADTSDYACLYIPRGTYICTAALDLTDIKNILIDGYLYFSTAVHGVAITIGQAAATNNAILSRSKVFIRRAIMGATVTAGDVVVQVNNSMYGDFDFLEVGGGETGIVFRANSTSNDYGCSYNTAKIGTINASKHGLVLEPTGTHGWTNVNRFFFHGVIQGIADNKGHSIWVKAGSGEQPNGNVFYNPVCGIGDYAIYLAAGMYNNFYNVYAEGDALLYAAAATYDNNIHVNYGVLTATDLSTDDTNRIYPLWRIPSARARAYLNTNQENLVNETQTIVALDAKSYDPIYENTYYKFNTTNHYFASSVSGYYHVIGQVTYGSAVADTLYYAIITQGAGRTTKVYKRVYAPVNGQFSVSVEDVIWIAKDDYIYLEALQYSGGDAVDVIAGAAVTYLTVSFVGA